MPVEGHAVAQWLRHFSTNRKMADSIRIGATGIFNWRNLLAPELFFLILAHPVYKTWIIQEPNTLELWNKLHFEEKKTEIIHHV